MNNRSDPPTPFLDPEVEGLLVDRERGELGPREARRLRSRLAADPAATEAASRRIGAFLDAAREAFEEDAPPDQVERVVARVRARTEALTGRERREAVASGAGRRLVWARILAVSVALHVVLLGFLVVRARQAERADHAVRISVELPAPVGLPETETYEEMPTSPWLPESGELRLPQATLADAGVTPPQGEERLAPLAEDRHAFAPSVAGPMQVRTRDALKRGRLQLLGLDADGTLKAVGRGLRALEARQVADGSFPAGGGRTALGTTALALLPFLGEGHGSRTGGDWSREVVAPGIDWVRRSLFVEPTAAADVPVAELGIALKALAEDYMLSYGRLRPVEAERRAVELQDLTARIVRTQDVAGLFPGANKDVRQAVWPMWGLEAAAHSGAVLPPARVAERFRTWYGSQPRNHRDEVAAGLLLARTLGDAMGRQAADRGARAALAAGVEPEDDAFLLAATGTGLLLHDPATFRTWSRGLDDKLIRRLLPTGVARTEDPIGDTAAILLALQVAYRTY